MRQEEVPRQRQSLSYHLSNKPRSGGDWVVELVLYTGLVDEMIGRRELAGEKVEEATPSTTHRQTRQDNHDTKGRENLNPDNQVTF